ncbi:MAG: GMC family oxidoreductase [Proteobacteria bacterium]|nr:GMC family oxidoreductase [Pseudomonadota bacterium]
MTLLSGADLTADYERSCDVCIVGSGAGGAVLAARLCAAGLDVVMLEEGGHYTRRDFDGDEVRAFSQLYQGRGAFATADLAMTILQGRSVGGSTTVNWTTCYRTPDRILDHWRSVHGIEGWDATSLGPHWDEVERRLGIAEWPESAANANNRALLDGCRALGWEAHSLKRNVVGCGNSGYCGTGCPLDAKQAMGISYLKDAQRDGLTLLSDVRVTDVVVEANRVAAVQGEVLDRSSDRPSGVRVVVQPKVAVLSAGAIGSPCVLLRSGLGEHGPVGRRTWMHPVLALPSFYAHPINGFYGAPQSIASHQFIDRGPGAIGWFLEVPPMQPVLISTGTNVFGGDLQQLMGRLPHCGSILAITVDGLLPHETGATVTLRKDGRPKVVYDWVPEHIEAFQEAAIASATLALATGADEVWSGHLDSLVIRSEADLPKLRERKYGPHEHRIFTAHQMGGCAMGPDPASSVVDSQLRHHQVPNLFVVDGSVLPTALGVNPSQTIYGIAHRASEFVGEAV